MKKSIKPCLPTILLNIIALTIGFVSATQASETSPVDNSVIELQRNNLADNTSGLGFGPQSPRDISNKTGENSIIFGQAPDSSKMNLCNIHFHKNAEHRGGEFTRYAGNGDGQGYQSGYLYSGKALNSEELERLPNDVCVGNHGGLNSGDTIEVHYVYSSAKIQPGPTLGACLSDSIANPQLRVEAQVYVLVNDTRALDFNEISIFERVSGKYQAPNTPNNTGNPVEYIGSTTGPSYNEQGSPFQVSWSVRPRVAKVDVNSIGTWCQGNVFEESHAHGVRNLVINPDLLSQMNK